MQNFYVFRSYLEKNVLLKEMVGAWRSLSPLSLRPWKIRKCVKQTEKLKFRLKNQKKVQDKETLRN